MANVINKDIVAIGIALQQYFAAPHDIESTALTIKRVNSVGSEWNSKIFGMNNLRF
jgi:hypothetical protein